MDLSNLGLTELPNKITECKNLKHLNISRNQIKDLRPLTQLKQLKVLLAGSNKIKNLSPLANLKNLQWLVLYNNHIEDIEPLANLNKLESLNLSINFISDFSALQKLPKLKKLDVSNNKPSKKYLKLKANKIAQIVRTLKTKGLKKEELNKTKQGNQHSNNIQQNDFFAEMKQNSNKLLQLLIEDNVIKKTSK